MESAKHQRSLNLTQDAAIVLALATRVRSPKAVALAAGECRRLSLTRPPTRHRRQVRGIPDKRGFVPKPRDANHGAARTALTLAPVSREARSVGEPT